MARNKVWIYRIVVGTLLVLTLAGCQITNVGNGPLRISSTVSNGYEKYLGTFSPGVFAVSQAGSCYSYYYCSGNCRTENLSYKAIQSCEKRCGVSCKVLAVYSSIVWNGPISGLPEKHQRPQDRPAPQTQRPIRMPEEPTTRIPIWQAKGCPSPDVSLFDGEPGPEFRDCPDCPEMVTVPPGTYAVGSTAEGKETPIHEVTFAKPFAVGKYEVTFDEWEACAADGGCNGYVPWDRGWGRGRQPVIGVSWAPRQDLCRLAVEKDRRRLPPAERSRMGVRRPRRCLHHLLVGR